MSRIDKLKKEMGELEFLILSDSLPTSDDVLNKWRNLKNELDNMFSSIHGISEDEWAKERMDFLIKLSDDTGVLSDKFRNEYIEAWRRVEVAFPEVNE